MTTILAVLGWTVCSLGGAVAQEEKPSPADALPPGAVVRMGATGPRESGEVHHLAFSPDGKLLLSCGASTQLWDVRWGNRIAAVPRGAYWAALSPDGKTLLTTDGSEVQLWEAATGKPLRKMTADKASFTRDFSRYARIGSGSQVALCDTSTEKEIRSFDAGEPVALLILSPDGSRLAAASRESVQVWATASGKKLGTLRPERPMISSLAFFPDGALLATGAQQGSLQVWNVGTGKEAFRLPAPRNAPVRSLAISDDGKRIATPGVGGPMVWDVSTQNLKSAIRPTTSPACVALSPDGSMVACGDARGAIRVWEVDSGKPLQSASGHEAPITCVALSADGRTAASGASDAIRLWDTATGRTTWTLKPAGYRVQSLHFAGAGGPLVSSSSSSSGLEIQTFDVATGKEISKRSEKWGQAVFSPDGRVVAVDAERGVRVLDRLGGKDVLRIELDPKLKPYAHAGPAILSLSQDGGRLLVVGSELAVSHVLLVREVPSGKELFRHLAQRQQFNSAAISPDGKMLAAHSAGTQAVHAWDVATGQELWASKPRSEGAKGELAFSRSGKTIAVVSRRGGATYLGAADGKELGALEGHDGFVTSLAFSGDGERLVTGSTDKTLIVWKVPEALR